MAKRWLVPVALAAAALTIAACGSSGGSGGSSTTGTNPGNASSGGALGAKTIGGAKVLISPKGFTVYWFVPDTSTTSKCTGTCASFWPPLKGPAKAGSGVTGTLGTITRSDGSVQATWNGHPLYTFKLDTAPGQNKGNGITQDGGLWHEVTLSGSPAPAKSSSGGGGGGYGY